MYSLLVSRAASEINPGRVALDYRRFLEYTDETIRLQLATLSEESVEFLSAWPCIFIQEGKGDEVARVLRVLSVQLKYQELAISLRILPNSPELTNDALWKLRSELDIEDFEFSRNHWAVKERDLFAILGSAGLSFDSGVRGQFAAIPLPAPNRKELLRARNVIGGWSHTEIDDFLLEAGIPDIHAERELGSRRDRANAIVQYSIDNPGATTADNSLLSAFLVRRALGETTEVATDPASGGVTTRPATAGEQSNSPADKLRAPIDHGRASTRSPNRVFVVHGRNKGALSAVVEYLRSVGLDGIVLHEQASMGRHLLTKFIEEAELVTFAVVLMTDDDVGGADTGHLAARARQNVILELGYFLSHLGQPRVCALISPGLETPSDFDGIVYISMRPDGEWMEELFRELVAAGMPVIA